MDPQSVKIAIQKNAIGSILIVRILPVLFLFAVLTDVSFFYIKQINNSYSDLADRRVIVMNDMNDVQNSVYTEDALVRDYLLTDNQAKYQEFLKLNQQVEVEINNVILLTKRQFIRDNLSNVIDVNRHYKLTVEQIISTNVRNHSEAISFFERSVTLVSQNMIKQLQYLSDNQLVYMSEVADTNTRIVAYTTTAIVITGLIGIIIGCLFINYISKSPLMKVKIMN